MNIRTHHLLGAGLLAALTPVMAIDLKPLWDFERPAVSEARFRAALTTAEPDDALILQTQIARSYGLRGDFGTARALLASIAPDVARASPEARTRHALETGRAYFSATHPEDARTEEAVRSARAACELALRTAHEAGLDALAIDAIHMLAIVEPAPADQVKRNREALAIATASSQPAAQGWEASIRNNLGMSLHALGRDDEALAEFERALQARQRGTNAQATRIARWMVAWALRLVGRADEALALQLDLERDAAAAGSPSRYVYEELETLHRARGDLTAAAHYAALKATLPN